MVMRVFFITTLMFNLVTCLLEGNIYAQDYAEVEWIRKYIGPDSINAVPKALEIDKQGNVYVAVDDESLVSGVDYVVIKYDSAGSERWIARYAGVGQARTDWLAKIAVDQSGNVYVTGNTSVPEYYTTLKYNSDGILQWTATTNKMGFASSSPSGLAVDKSGNVYVAIFCCDLIKYDQDGNQVWRKSDSVNIYSMALDDDANIYLAGSNFIKKHDSNGIQQWQVADTLEPRSIILDGRDNVYVRETGSLSRYSSDGAQKWNIRLTQRVLTRCLTVDPEGNPITVGDDLGYNGEFHTVKFDSQGTKMWETIYRNEYENPPQDFWPDESTDIRTDRLGNVYVVGFNHGPDGTSDIATLKYSPSGELKWVMRYGNPRGNFLSERPTIAVRVDSMGNVYVLGNNVFRVNHYMETVTIKYRQPNFITTVSAGTSSPLRSAGLSQNYPNPFNPETVIKYEIPWPVHVTLKIYTLLGQEIRALVDRIQGAGIYEATWDGKDETGRAVPSGLYLYRIEVGEYTQVKKMALLR
jgi:hypothetical protein